MEKTKGSDQVLIDTALFPILFSIEDDLRTVNRFADFWEGIGLTSEVQRIGPSYVLILHAPEAGELS